MDKWWKQLGKWFTNATLTAANADAPAITTASGWQRDENRTWNQNAMNDKGVKELRDNIATLFMLGEGANITPLIASWYNILRNPIKTYNTIKVSAKQAKEYLQKYLSLVKGPRTSRTFVEKRSKTTKPFADYMESFGVDSSYFTEQDLNDLMKLHYQSVNSNIPSGRSATVEDALMSKNFKMFDIFDNGNFIGDIEIYPKGKDMVINMVDKVIPSAKNLSQSAYDAAINYSKNLGYSGLRSGDVLISPEITYKVWEHYPNKQFIGNVGKHTFNFGRDVANGQKSFAKINQPVYRLTEATSSVPTKHRKIFHPDIIQNGSLKLPDWKNPDIYKITIPTVLGVGLSQ